MINGLTEHDGGSAKISRAVRVVHGARKGNHVARGGKKAADTVKDACHVAGPVQWISSQHGQRLKPAQRNLAHFHFARLFRRVQRRTDKVDADKT